MIQFNLLPEVKLEYIRAQRTKHLTVVVAAIVTSVSLLILISLCLVVFVFQKKYINDLSGDIRTASIDLQSTPDLNKILTVQNQLNSLSDLHAQKPDVSRIFPFIKSVTPEGISISSLTIDFDTQTMVINGGVNSTSDNKLSDINKYVDTLKFTQYKKGDATGSAFSNVVLTSFGRSDKTASYTITLNFDPEIFTSAEDVTLTVPDKITTRSETEKPTALFETTPKGQ